MADIPGHNGKSVLPASILIIIDQESANLHRALRNDFAGFHFEIHSSFDQAKSRVRGVERYQALIINAQMAAVHDFSLLKRNGPEQLGAPVLVTASTASIHEKALARRALQRGALGCILKPITDGYAASTVRRAISLSKLWTTIARTEQTLEGFKEQRTDRSVDPAATVRRTIEALETTLQILKRVAHDEEQQARHQALERLETFEPT